ncbi:murein L,D-transpeptidase catalytic domain-containing protein [Chryseobacterium arthrosphaerae]|uniref:murein L,D-transpeptidase catalytic domain-containing protein n=1 Tax=Chryseobacterium arthrosphaerae TaxID=651561 RepID=UPI001F4B8599|nr:murein L,D-transpeptidase catalytic domain family protein [Chryseobacterium arthrosphaerae]MDG4653861.1 murein L,D-transpeptidase catalytic domain family protein [Chryseobacterium arthrosphaerae]
MRTGFLFIIIFILSSCSQKKQKEIPVAEIPAAVEKKPAADFSKTKMKAEEALEFCTSGKFNTDFCIMIDMSLHSGINRFFVWDFKTNSISKQYLVGHGCGSNSWSKDDSKSNPGFSNEDGSHLSSLGKYKLEGRGYSDWGIHIKYLMHGLEDTNSNALKRFIVFHSWDKMSDEETFPEGSPEGWGCPTVSNNAMKEIDPMIQKSGKPVLMWIYN